MFHGCVACKLDARACGILVAIFAIIVLVGFTVGFARGDDLPDPNLTPCAADPALTKEVLCKKGFHTKTQRAVSSAAKDQICREYGKIAGCWHKAAKCPGCPHEIDHCLAITDGGAEPATKVDSCKTEWNGQCLDNFWPQSYVTLPWSAYRKDALEVRLHKLVCAGKIELDEAQRVLRTDWTAGYIKYIGDPAKAKVGTKKKHKKRVKHR